MELTSIELQRLPVTKDRPNFKQTSFVLHGSPPASDESVQSDKFKAYVSRQVNGGLSLFKQGFSRDLLSNGIVL